MADQVTFKVSFEAKETIQLIVKLRRSTLKNISCSNSKSKRNKYLRKNTKFKIISEFSEENFKYMISNYSIVSQTDKNINDLPRNCI